MAWEGLVGTLNPGQSVQCWYSWGGYNGIDIPSVRPLTPNAKLLCTSHGGRLEQSGMYTYFVEVTNHSGFPASFTLVGTSGS